MQPNFSLKLRRKSWATHPYNKGREEMLISLKSSDQIQFLPRKSSAACPKKFFKTACKVISFNSIASGLGAGAGYYSSGVFGPLVIQASVKIICNKLIKGMMGRLIASLAAPWCAARFSSLLMPISAIVGGAGGLLLYHSAHKVYQLCSAENWQETAEALLCIQIIVEKLVLTSALEPKQAYQFFKELKKADPKLARIIKENFSKALDDLEKSRSLEEGFVWVANLFEEEAVRAAWDSFCDVPDGDLHRYMLQGTEE